MNAFVKQQEIAANKTYPQFTAPYVNNDNYLYQNMELFYMLEVERVYPEYMWIHMALNSMQDFQEKDYLH